MAKVSNLASNYASALDYSSGDDEYNEKKNEK
jgi:hypothetical protein